eukprot:CAMPEP_0113900640 /NCGR_PEP_ID=MMETSP0780_2-20120614/20795_1 /TAXON_ID=652834 /ORGANISM="Palpitomonas bilix" /LENGTH=456 /DNA_ID=CAMNT_0000893133 /DNA_START=133 /DNA_END=1503 /DNA_ORIENTATION=- /assembly_acc=CAM_ASM_000599
MAQAGGGRPEPIDQQNARAAPPRDVFANIRDLQSEYAKATRGLDQSDEQNSVAATYLEKIQLLSSMWEVWQADDIDTVLMSCKEELNRVLSVNQLEDKYARLVAMYDKARRTFIHKSTQSRALAATARRVVNEPADDVFEAAVRIRKAMLGFELAGLDNHDALLLLSKKYFEISKDFDECVTQTLLLNVPEMLEQERRDALAGPPQPEPGPSRRPRRREEEKEVESDEESDARYRTVARRMMEDGQRPIIGNSRPEPDEHRTALVPVGPISRPSDNEQPSHLGRLIGGIARPVEIPDNPADARRFFRQSECILCCDGRATVGYSPCNHVFVCTHCLKYNYHVSPAAIADLQVHSEIRVTDKIFEEEQPVPERGNSRYGAAAARNRRDSDDDSRDSIGTQESESGSSESDEGEALYPRHRRGRRAARPDPAPMPPQAARQLRCPLCSAVPRTLMYFG